MADIVEIGNTKDTGSGKVLKTGSMRRKYNTKKGRKKKKKSCGIKFRNGSSKYKAGR